MKNWVNIDNEELIKSLNALLGNNNVAIIQR